MLGIDSPYDYDPVWQKCLELRIAPSFHNGARTILLRNSPSNFCYNHIGHFASAGEALCKALFFGGVTRRFPDLNFAFLEGGVGWACDALCRPDRPLGEAQPPGAREHEPGQSGPRRLLRAGRRVRRRAEWWSRCAAVKGSTTAGTAPAASDDLDDCSRCGIEQAEDIRELFMPNFYFGCEADDPINAWAFNRKLIPFGRAAQRAVRLGHRPLGRARHGRGGAEAHEMVEDGLITADDFRDFMFATPVRFWAGMNPDFFKGTVVEKAAAAALARTPARTRAS